MPDPLEMCAPALCGAPGAPGGGRGPELPGAMPGLGCLQVKLKSTKKGNVSKTQKTQTKINIRY